MRSIVNRRAGPCALGNACAALGSAEGSIDALDVLPGEGRAYTFGRGPWLVAHAACFALAMQGEREGPRGERVHTFQTSGGTFYRNARGRCEDAPCCGCCTI